jgi:hypothetical protein
MESYRNRIGPSPRCLPAHPCAALLLGLLIGVALPTMALAQAGSATLRGWVLRAGTDEPLRAARVELLGMKKAAVTDSAGRFEVAGLPAGVVVAEVQYLGMGSRRWKVPLHADAATSIVFRVGLGIIPVPAIHVTVKRVVWPQMRGFEERMEHREGTFITRDEIRRRQPHVLSDLIRTVPGVTFAPPHGEFDEPHVEMGHGRLTCTPTLYMDGHRVTAFRLDDFAPEHIEAIEVYTRMSLVPGQYRIGPDRCGAILLWSRDTF